MKVILISDNGTQHKKITISAWRHIILPLSVVLTVIALGFVMRASFSQPPALLSNNEQTIFKNYQSVLHKLNRLDAEVKRLNTLGARIALKNKLDVNDFDLAHQAINKTTTSKDLQGSNRIVRGSNIAKNIHRVERKLRSQRTQLSDLQTSFEILQARKKLAKLVSSAESSSAAHDNTPFYEFTTPMKTGYISSPYGSRKDPINGSMRHHNGVDIAARKGSNVYAIANGFVTFRARKGAYGNLLEINHSATLKSRYAHLDQFLVKKGQIVHKGDLIGKVGATGRVTGPHLHLEIFENNKVADPKMYLHDALGNIKSASLN